MTFSKQTRSKVIKFTILIFTPLALTGCLGNSSVDVETVAQIKSITHETPIICPDYHELHLSLGVMRGGVGSMSISDIVLEVEDELMIESIKTAAVDGKLLKVTYNIRRMVFCVPSGVVTAIEVIK